MRLRLTWKPNEGDGGEDCGWGGEQCELGLEAIEDS